ncbi:DUF4270 domain-containing protein [Halosquirtibacter xylanolyticus]|uniref:DUF4270 family protein n=1 Tax=Halosquirtibacter xylanolyticus TaxID=3374599 RepID=UPI0037492EEB|nr:DUF4270 domain-containing protein [Prolixibacteraceae bacterium]
MKTIKRIKSKVQILLLLFITGFVLFACQEKNTGLGLELVPSDEQIQVMVVEDENTSDSYYELDSPIRVDEPSNCVFGVLNDPVFGQTKASIATQMRLISKPQVNGTSVLDSAVFLLSYRSVYGDTLTPQTIVVKELKDELYKDKSYMSSFDVSTLASDNVIGTGTFTPSFAPSGSDTLTQVARVPVNAAFAQKILDLWDKTADDGKLVFDHDDLFLKEFKGVYVEPADIPSNRKGALLKTNSSYSKGSGSGSYTVDLRLRMYIYAKTKVDDTTTDDPNDTKEEQKVISMYSTSYSATVPKMVHDYSSVALNTDIGNTKSTAKRMYIQPNEGLRSVVKVNKLADLRQKWTVDKQLIDPNAPSDDLYKNDKIFITNSSMKIYVDTLASDYKTLGIPSILTLRYLAKDSEEGDLRENGSNYISGAFDRNTSSYVFDMTKHVINYLHDKVDSEDLYVIPYYRVGSTNRAVLFSNDSDKGIDFKVTYIQRGAVDSNK